ncbi:hypothetical protein NST04_21845 [Paenibacillus sp. FSL H7-0756]
MTQVVRYCIFRYALSLFVILQEMRGQRMLMLHQLGCPGLNIRQFS